MAVFSKYYIPSYRYASPPASEPKAETLHGNYTLRFRVQGSGQQGVKFQEGRQQCARSPAEASRTSLKKSRTPTVKQLRRKNKASTLEFKFIVI